MVEVLAAFAKGQLPCAGDADIVPRHHAVHQRRLVAIQIGFVEKLRVVFPIVVVSHQERQAVRHRSLGFHLQRVIVVGVTRPPLLGQAPILRIRSQQLAHSHGRLRPQHSRHFVGRQQIVEGVRHRLVHQALVFISQVRVHLIHVVVVAAAPHTGILGIMFDHREEGRLGEDPLRPLPLDGHVEAVVERRL